MVRDSLMSMTSIWSSDLDSFGSANFYVRKFYLPQEGVNFLYKEVPNFIVFNETKDSKILGTDAWVKFGRPPEETIGFDFTNFGFKDVHISLIMAYKGDVWLGDEITLISSNA